MCTKYWQNIFRFVKGTRKRKVSRREKNDVVRYEVVRYNRLGDTACRPCPINFLYFPYIFSFNSRPDRAHQPPHRVHTTRNRLGERAWCPCLVKYNFLVQFTARSSTSKHHRVSFSRNTAQLRCRSMACARVLVINKTLHSAMHHNQGPTRTQASPSLCTPLEHACTIQHCENAEVQESDECV